MIQVGMEKFIVEVFSGSKCAKKDRWTDKCARLFFAYRYFYYFCTL